MTEDKFLELTLLLRKHWDKHTGILMRLQRAEEDKNPLLLCVGRLDNNGVRAEFCRLWQGDNLLFHGPINHPELLAILHDHSVCFAELNTASKLDVKEGSLHCFGNPLNCTKECMLKERYAEPSIVQCADETVRTSEDRK